MPDRHLNAKLRHDFVYLFDVTDGNPNGDPDAGNLPRVDPQTMNGLVTDVAIKRRIRDWIDLAKSNEKPYEIYVRSGRALNDKHEDAYKAKNIPKTGSARQVSDRIAIARQWMCESFYDIRMFGAVMTTGVNCGQVRGPIQLTFARSIDRIVRLDFTITRLAVTKAEDVRQEKEGSNEVTGKGSTMGRKSLVPYGLYRAHGFFNPHFAQDTGVTEEDLGLFWQALCKAWDHDRSAARGQMACRGIFIFSHDSPLGNAPAHQLQARIETPPSEKDAPRAFSDYAVRVNDRDLPPGVTLTRLCE